MKGAAFGLAASRAPTSRGHIRRNSGDDGLMHTSTCRLAFRFHGPHPYSFVCVCISLFNNMQSGGNAEPQYGPLPFLTVTET